MTNTNMQIPGLLIGNVIQNYDEKNKGMVKVKINGYKIHEENTSWIRVMTPFAGKGKGFCFLPEIGDTVLIGFIDNNINNPVVIGCLHNMVNEYPHDLIDKDDAYKALITKNGIKILFYEEDNKNRIEIITPNKLALNLDDAENTIKLGYKEEDFVEINCKNKHIQIKAKDNITLESEEIYLNAKRQINIKGGKVEINGTGTTKIKGGTTEINGTGATKIKGGIVEING